jgi:hypothetical protein
MAQLSKPFLLKGNFILIISISKVRVRSVSLKPIEIRRNTTNNKTVCITLVWDSWDQNLHRPGDFFSVQSVFSEPKEGNKTKFVGWNVNHNETMCKAQTWPFLIKPRESLALTWLRYRNPYLFVNRNSALYV